MWCLDLSVFGSAGADRVDLLVRVEVERSGPWLRVVLVWPEAEDVEEVCEVVGVVGVGREGATCFVAGGYCGGVCVAQVMSPHPRTAVPISAVRQGR